jgi:hypothetical protein
MDKKYIVYGLDFEPSATWGDFPRSYEEMLAHLNFLQCEELTDTFILRGHL